jgi:hypothetical protein
MAKNNKVDESRIKAAIAAIKDRKGPGVIPASQTSQIANLRRKLGKRLQAVFAAAGLDVDKINKILAEHQGDLRSVFEKNKAKSAKNLAAVSKNLQRGLKNQRKALEHLASKPFITTPIPLLAAYSIFATPVGMLTDSHIEAMNNWARFSLHEDGDTGYTDAYVRFYFFWQNQSNYLAVINADSDLAALGVTQANASPGFIVGGNCAITLYATLKVFVGSLEIAYQGTQTVEIDSLTASGGSEIILQGGDVETHNIDGTLHHLSCSNIEVDSGQTVVFEVALDAQYYIDNGSITLDFDYSDYSVLCPGLTVELLTAPPATLLQG